MSPVHVLITLCAILAGSEANACDPGLPLPRDCAEVYQRGCTQEGVYTIDPYCPNINSPFQVYCSNQSIVMQRRMDGSENFDRDWVEYVQGFGNKRGEHWLGLEKIHCLTTQTARAQLKIDLADFRGDKKYAHYSFFMVGNAASKYTLQTEGYTGTAGDSIKQHNQNGMQFTTRDRDNDQRDINCAHHQLHGGGAWWFKHCAHAHLNGPYYHDTAPKPWHCVLWYTMTGNTHSLKFTEMKLKTRD